MAKKQDVTVPKKGDIIKSNSIIRAMYKHSMTVWEMRLFHACLAQVDGTGKLDHTQMFTVSASEVIKITGTGIDGAYKKLRRAAKKLMQMTITVYDDPEGNTLKVEKDINLFAECTYVPRQGKVKLQFTHPIIKYISSLSACYTRLHSIYLMRFSSMYAIRIYELCVQLIKIRNEAEFSVNELRALLGIEEKRYKRFERFRTTVILPACTQINRLSDIRIEPHFIREGKWVKKIKFVFQKLDPEEIEIRNKLYGDEYLISLDADAPAPDGMGHELAQAALEELRKPQDDA